MIRGLIVVLSVLAISASAETRVPQNRAEISLGFAALVKQAAPAVVNIYAQRIVARATSPFADDPFFQNLFRGFGETRPEVQNSLGSGVILSGDGYVVSNYHVVGGASDIRVVLNDRREFVAEVLLADEEADLAILRLEEARDMPHLALRDSDTVEVGELVLAIGNPFGVGQTVTSGIVSGLARSGTATGNSRGLFLQTDAAINPGNSGGALVDVNGALIGVNTSILTRSGGSNGIGFAIPSSLVAQYLAQAQAGNVVFQKPWAGMNGQSVDADMAESLGMTRPMGILISGLHDVSPFLVAGFQTGDVILAVAGQAVNTPAEMIFRMSVVGLGADVSVSRWRAGQSDDVAVSLMAAPDVPPRAALVTDSRAAIPELAVANINPAVLAEYGLPLGIEGVVITDPGPVGAQLGLETGDILRAVDGRDIGRTEEVVSALIEARRVLRLDIQRGTQRVSMRFRL